jgi:hypothetical protein
MLTYGAAGRGLLLDLSTLLYMCPHTAICVLILLYMCPHTALCVLIRCRARATSRPLYTPRLRRYERRGRGLVRRGRGLVRRGRGFDLSTRRACAGTNVLALLVQQHLLTGTKVQILTPEEQPHVPPASPVEYDWNLLALAIPKGVGQVCVCGVCV